MTGFRFFLIALTFLVASKNSTAQSGSDKPIHIIVPYAVGGLLDATNRVIAMQMATTLRQPIIIENRPGANANIGAALVARATPDGYTLLASSSYYSTNPLIEKNLQWNPKELVPIARFALAPSVLVVSGSASPSTLKDFLAFAKLNPGTTVAEAGLGATQTMVTRILQDSAKVKFLPVQYKGGVSYIPDLVSGNVTMGVIPINAVLGLIKSGKLKALAITSSHRSTLLPEVPTLSESGFPEASLSSWLGVHAPAGTAPETIKRLSDAIASATSNEAVKSQLLSLGAESAFLDTKSFEIFLQQDLARAERFVQLISAELNVSRK